MVGNFAPNRNYTNYLDGWQEYSSQKPLPPARIIDDYFALKKCALPWWKINHLLSEFHGKCPAAIWVEIRAELPQRDETSPMLPAVRFHPQELTGLNNHLWQLADSFLSFFAKKEDQIRHKSKMPPGWSV